MSFLAIAWSEKVSVADVHERAILTLMAHRADDDGEGIWLFNGTTAEYCMCDERTITRKLKALRERGVIAEGDQSLVDHLDPDHRPVVYDLMIPYRWFSEDQLEDVQRFRRRARRVPLTPEMRPPLPVAEPSRKVRSDAGTKKPVKASLPVDESDEQPLNCGNGAGGLQVTPVEDAQDGVTTDAEVTTSHAGGGLVVTSRGDYKSDRNSPLETVQGNTGGEVPGERHQRAKPDRDAPPPPLVKADWRDPATCLCADHLALVMADPGAEVPACHRCGRVAAWGERKRAEAAAEVVEQEAARRAEVEQRERDCPWHDAAGWVLDPDDVLRAAVKCDHETHPDVLRARALEAASRVPAPVAEAGRAAAYAMRAATAPKRAPEPRLSRRIRRPADVVDNPAYDPSAGSADSGVAV